MYNVVCVKYGDLYTHEDANRLYRMAKKNISLPFSFYCFTENPDNLDKDIIHIPLDESLELDSYWWKMELFNPKKYPNNNTTVYFDLDVIITKNIDFLFNSNKNKITTLYTGSINPKFDGFPDVIPYINTSLMVYKPKSVEKIYNEFIKNLDFNVLKYHGICRYLSHKHQDLIDAKFKFPDYQSILHRYAEADKIEVEKHRVYLDKEKTSLGKKINSIIYHPDAFILLLNGTTRIGAYKEALEYFSEYYK